MKHIAYDIPPKIDAGGGFFGGRVKLRNMIEGIALWFGTYYLLKALLFFLPARARLVFSFLLAVAAGFIGIMGIGGMSLSESLFLYIKFKKNATLYTLAPPEVVKEKKNEKRK